MKGPYLGQCTISHVVDLPSGRCVIYHKEITRVRRKGTRCALALWRDTYRALVTQALFANQSGHSSRTPKTIPGWTQMQRS